LKKAIIYYTVFLVVAISVSLSYSFQGFEFTAIAILAILLALNIYSFLTEGVEDD